MKLISFIIILLPFIVFSQNEHTEYKKVFYDKHLSPTDSINSVFWGYDIYFNNKFIYDFSKKKITRKRQKHQTEGEYDSLVIGKPVLLDDMISITEYNRANHVVRIKYLKYEDGYLKYYEINHFKKMAINPYFVEIIDLDKKYETQEGSYFSYELHGKGVGKTNERWFCFNGKKWKRKSN